MKHWFSRLLPVGGVALGLTAVAWGLSFGPIAEDVAGRTAERLKSEGRSWAKITMDGRDLTLTGTAPDPATRRLAAESADRVFGVRIVDDRATEVPLADPYGFGAARSGDKITLSGSVPSEEARAAILAAVKTAAPGASIADEMKLARGAPPIYATAAAFAIGQLGGLSAGSVAVAPNGYAIAGQPKDFATYKALEAALKSAMPQGLKLASDQLAVPAPTPYRLGLTTRGGVATLDGFLPSADAKAKVLALLTGLYSKVDDGTEIAPGAPAGFVDAIVAALPGLKRLSDGGFDLSGTRFTVKGGVLTEAIGRQILDRLRGLLPAGFALADVAPTLLPPPPQVDPATCQATLAAVQSGEKIQFEVGKAALDARSVGVLDMLVGGALACRTARITVEGHTDSDGDPDANMALSEARAAAVVEYLVAAGIAADRLTATGFGETAPIASNDTAEGKQQNRRIDFRVE